MPDRDRRIIGTGEKDETIGRLLERTEQLMNQNESFERTLGSFNLTMGALDRTVAKLEGTVKDLSNAINRQDEIDDRCDQHEKRLDALDLATVHLPTVTAEVLFWRRALGGGFHAFWKLVMFAIGTGGLGAAWIKLMEKFHL